MPYNPNIHHRKSIRLKGYDYSKEGLYFITICTHNREHLFGEIPVGAVPRVCPNHVTQNRIDSKIELNNAGKMIRKIWFEMPQFYSGFKLHEFIVMPNHIHGIIEINMGERVLSISEIIR